MEIRPNTIAFVSPRYGPEVIGGAEASLTEMIHGLAERGYPIEVLTTCAVDHYTWANEFPAGVSRDGDVTVRRFEAINDSDGAYRSLIGARIEACEHVSINDQQLWVNDSLRCPDMWHHVLAEGSKYRALIFAPYMFWTTYAVSQIHPAKSIIQPCLHEEPAATLGIFKPMIEGAAGLFFLTDPEAELANRLFDIGPRHEMIGSGVPVPAEYDPLSFRKEYSISAPYVYYAGRREAGKGWPQLIEGFRQVVREYGDELVMVTSGTGDMGIPADLSRSVIDVGNLSAQMRDNAMAGALAYVQPSMMESFSRTVLESWLAGTPVIANGRSAVVRWHVERSQAGFAYSNQDELIEAMMLLAADPDLGQRLAKPGSDYVLNNYQWSSVLDRVEAALDRWLPISVEERAS